MYNVSRWLGIACTAVSGCPRFFGFCLIMDRLNNRIIVELLFIWNFFEVL